MMRFKKQLITAGTHTHPTAGYTFTPTGATLEHWAQSVSELQAAGHVIDVRIGHDDDGERVGELMSAHVEGGALVGVMELSVDDPKEVEDADVSIYSPANFTDHRGRSWKFPILHVAVVRKGEAAIVGLEPFALAASAGAYIQLPGAPLDVRSQSQRIMQYATQRANSGGADALKRMQEAKYAKPTEPEPKRDITPRELYITTQMLAAQRRAQLSGTSTGDTHDDHDRN